MKVFLAGRVAAENHAAAIDEAHFPGRQGRLLFAYLVVAQGRPVPRGELADVLWERERPATWEKALSVLASKLRAALATDGAVRLTAAFGCYRLDLAGDTWVDVFAAENAASDAEAALARADIEGAKRTAATAESLARGSFLPGDDGSWVEQKRRDLAAVRARALTTLAEASLRANSNREAVRWAEQAVEVEPFRESGYRQLMESHVAAGNRAEALRVYERCRQFLAQELGAYPSPETEALYRDLLQAPVARQPDRAASDGATRRRPRRHRGTTVAIALFVAACVGGAVVAHESRGQSPPVVIPNSLVRVDPHTLRVEKVFPVSNQPDLVVAAGGYVWVTNHILRDVNSGALRNGGDRTLVRVDPSTGKAVFVGGGLAPCGLSADPSGDVWVANCYPHAIGSRDTVVRVNAKTLAFTKTWRVRGGDGFLRGLAYGGGSLWVGPISGGNTPNTNAITQVNPQTGSERTFRPQLPADEVTWAGSYGDLWMANFDEGSITRLHTQTGSMKTFSLPLGGPAFPLVDHDTVWVADWNGPHVARLSAVGPPRLHMITLPMPGAFAGVWSLAAGGGSIWATTARDGTLWRIDEETNAVTPIALPYVPTGVAADANAVWVTVRGR